jgi:hypothetical protein
LRRCRLRREQHGQGGDEQVRGELHRFLTCRAGLLPGRRRRTRPDTTRRGSCNEPSAFVDIELDRSFAAHFQQQRLASFLICNIGASHDLVDLERLFAERVQDILSIVQHE